MTEIPCNPSATTGFFAASATVPKAPETISIQVVKAVTKILIVLFTFITPLHYSFSITIVADP